MPGSGAQLGLRFVASDSEQVDRRRLHLHLTSESAFHQHAIVDTVLQLGGRHLDVGQEEDAAFVVLADPESNEFCVIEPRNDFLAGTGRLGEIACDGTRNVGLFWRDALGWPLGWDQDEETSVQSPAGGTKLSWGGPPVAPKSAPSRQRFSLLADDPDAETTRLLRLGASRGPALDGGWQLVDPDGNEFDLHRR